MDCPIVNLAKELISIPSISPSDLGCQKIISDRLSYMGFKSVYLNYNNTNNLWSYRGEGVTLSFAGHTDVVPAGNVNFWHSPPFIPTIRHGCLFGRGASDMKGALAAMIIAAERFIYSFPNYNGRLSFLITSDEESTAVDGTVKLVNYLESIQEKIDYCILGEPSSTNIIGDMVKIGRRGSLNVDLFIYGSQGHIAYPENADNPIHNSLSFLNELTSFQWSHGNKDFSPTKLQISNISSGTGSDNIIPGELRVSFNFRFGSDISLHNIKNHVLYLLSKHNLKYKILWRLSGEPFLNISHNLADIVMHSVKKISNIDTTFSTTGGTSDGRFLSRICSELIELGLINNTIHQINEHVKITDLKCLSLIYENIMKKILV
ncbi:succinyl-diaminopimelate desuccinylase [Buchnera aphidicola]|uniref:succinyl-diaminopimelate desuccinylase n=1 Tax=Buchnera aphidicola TaxID=9 RepID=UPI003463C322